MKRQLAKSILIMSIVLLCVMAEKNDAKAATWKNNSGQWINDDKCIYITGNTLYISPFAPHSMGIKDELANWKMDTEYESLKIVTIYNDTVYVVLYHDTGKSTLYSVNIKSKQKRKAVRNCYAFAAKGKYIYGNPCKVSDTGAYTVRIWKIKNNSVKRVKTIGKNIFGTTAVKKKLYYASYPNKYQKKMTVYRCNLDGSHRKKLFTIKGKGKYCQVLMTDANKKTITAIVSGDNPKTYVYTIKSKTLKEK